MKKSKTKRAGFMIAVLAALSLAGCSNSDYSINQEGTIERFHPSAGEQYAPVEEEISEEFYVEKAEDSCEIEQDSRYSCVAVEDGFEITFYSNTNEEILSEYYPKEPTIRQITENIFEIRISVGSPAAYVFYVDTDNAEASETFFNPLLIGDCYVAYMEDGKLILRDIFHEESLYMAISRDFTKTADPISAIIAIEMQDRETITLSYYKGEDFEETSEIITIY